MIAFAPTAMADPAPAPGWMRVLQTYDQQLATIGYRLALSGGDLCRDRAALTGIVVQDVSQYDPRDRDDARRIFGFAGYPEVLASTGAAAAAGVAADDAILAIDGSPVASSDPAAPAGSAPSDAVRDRLDQAAAAGPVTLRLMRGGRMFEVRFTPVSGCATRFQTSTADTVDAAADGHVVEVNVGALRFAGDNQQAAAIVAHELAHNILRHRARLAAAGVRNDRSRRGARLALRTEEEADRLSVYLMDRAGYDPRAALTLWTRIGETGGVAESHPRAHLVPASRVAMIAAEIAHLTAMKAAGQAPRPDFMTGDTLPPLE